MKQLLFALCILELFLATWGINALGPYGSSLLLTCASLGIAMAYLHVAARPVVNPAANPAQILPPRLMAVLQWGGFTGISMLIFMKLTYLWGIAHTGTGNERALVSDIIPQVAALVQRFLSGQQPYYTIQFPGHSIYPTYLPFQWMPYIPFEVLRLDYRWLPAITMWGAALWFFIKHRKAAGLWGLLVPYWPLLVWAAFMLRHNDVFVVTVEGFVAACYFLVAAALSRRNTLVLAIAISVCLLSRYSIIFWVPLCIALYYVAGQRRGALIICGMAAVFFICFYWLPFLRHDPGIFASGYSYHTHAALGEWQRDLATHGGATYLYNGLGLTPFALKLLPGHTAHILSVYKTIHLAVCVIAVTMAGIVYVRRKPRYPLHSYLLAAFKIYLTVFYTFIQIPYIYLFLVPVFITAILLGHVLAPGAVKEKPTFMT